MYRSDRFLVKSKNAVLEKSDYDSR